ncbi:MAG: siroheme synthase [Euzebyaceae bacterium]|jgi:precorrin-2 dehydrogenase/sirohydrochlorin ferrochelatase|nr:siroheme synthase [Euzebyaceae bacterium]
MDKPSTLPLLVGLAGRRVVGVGGGAVATAKLLPLAEAGAKVIIVAPNVQRELAASAVVHRRPYAGPQDLAGAFLVVAATADASVNARVAADAEALATFCVRVDRDPDATAPGSAAFASAVRHGPLTIAVSTDGQAPSLARWLRGELEDAYGPEYGELAALLGELRRDPQVRRHLASLDSAGRRAAWRAIPLADILRLIRKGSVLDARELALACLSSSSD